MKTLRHKFGRISVVLLVLVSSGLSRSFTASAQPFVVEDPSNLVYNIYQALTAAEQAARSVEEASARLDTLTAWKERVKNLDKLVGHASSLGRIASAGVLIERYTRNLYLLCESLVEECRYVELGIFAALLPEKFFLEGTEIFHQVKDDIKHYETVSNRPDDFTWLRYSSEVAEEIESKLAGIYYSYFNMVMNIYKLDHELSAMHDDSSFRQVIIY